MTRDMNGPPSNRLTLVVGPANSGKMGHVLRWWSDRLAQKAVMVVPTGPDAQEISLEMARRTGGLLGQSPAVTFEGLVRLLLQRSPRYATDLERALIAARLLQQTPLRALDTAVRLPGTVTALSMLLQQLGESGRTPEDLDRILARWAAADPGSAPLAGDVGRLLKAYEQTCVDLGLTDRPAAVREATRVAEGWTRPVALYGFTSFTPGQRALVDELSRDVEVLVAFTYDRSRAVNLSTPAEIAWWEARAAEVVEVAPSTRAYTSPAVAYLERYFMGEASRPEPPVSSSGSEGVRFLLASGQRAEAELAAEQIADLIRAGARPRDIAVVVRQVPRWSGLLGRVFDSCGIPYQMDDRCVLGETGLGHAFLSALKGVALDDPEGILAYLRSPYSGVSLDDVSDLELIYRRGAAKGARVLAGIAKSMGMEAVGDLWGLVDSGTCEPRFDPIAADRMGRRMLTAGLRGPVVGGGEVEARWLECLSPAAGRRAVTGSRSLASRGLEPAGSMW
jgi:ATP-dependent helicase/DNAse subunit B